ncbi:MAG: hypothetical protein IPL61_02660 [Myxococcales bacterium]|nr:hypothetical protein [Myxococcales bacterium]
MSQSKVNQKSYAVGRFGLQLEEDGGSPIDVSSYLKNVEGGLPKIESTKEQVGSFNQPRNHLATRTVEPITFEVGLCQANPLLKFVQNVINNRVHKRLSGHIFHADANSKSRFEQEFARALVTEIAFPALDAAGKDLALLKVKVQPETASFNVGSGQAIPMGVERAQKVWQNNSFRLELESNGTKFDCTHATKIEALTVTIGAKAVQRGRFLLPEYMPTQVKMPKLSIHVPLHHAGSLIDWFRNVANSEASKTDGAGGYEATGSLTYLDTTTSKDLYHITFEGLAPEQMTIVKSEGGSATLKTCKFDFYLTNMLLNV